jgi:hypothetical protein
MDTQEELFIMIAIFIAFIAVGFASYQIGSCAIKREAVVAGHAVWDYDEVGYPKFHWKN